MPNEATPGTVLLGKYRVDAILGQGGMGVVAACTHLQLGEKVAIKFLRPDVVADDETCRRFLREAQAAVRLKSEHVARVSDVGTLPGGAPFLVMEYLEGVDLDQMVTASGPVDAGLAVELVLQGCEALAEAHACGIVHRDIKPSNFFVTWRSDGSPLVKLLDFGISKAPVAEDVSLTRTQSTLGTPAYMSPEQMRSARTVDARTDVWSVGAVLYELIEGRRPFEAESFSEMCVKVAMDPPAPMGAEVERGLVAVVMRCLEKDPARRWQDVGELAVALSRYARDAVAAVMIVERIQRTLAMRPRAATPLPVATPAPVPVPVPVSDPGRAPRTRRMAVIGGAAVLTIAVGIGVAVAVGGGGEEPRREVPALAAPVVDAGVVSGIDAEAPSTSTSTPTSTSTIPEPTTTTTTTTSTSTSTKDERKKRKKKRVKKADDVFGSRK